MNERALAEWFKRRKESKIVVKTREHLLRVVDATAAMDDAIKAMEQHDTEGARKAIQRAILAEKAADHAEISLHESIATGDLMEKNREDLLHLVKRIDHVADWQKGAARNLEILLDANVKVSSEIWSAIRKISMAARGAAEALKEAVEHLSDDKPEKMLAHLRDVEHLEHEIDDLYFLVKKKFVLSSEDPRILLVLRDLLHSLENSADNAKAAADLLHIISMAG
ncbi:MAG: DUF47 family protein [Candidatus Thermoplasmatota archaeon]